VPQVVAVRSPPVKFMLQVFKVRIPVLNVAFSTNMFDENVY